MINIPFGKPLINDKEIFLVKEVLKSSILVHGNKTKIFEKNFKKFVGAKEAITVSSCTAGMHLIFFHLGIGKGDEVIVPSQTHVATAHAVELTGARPVFIDSEIKTGNIDINKIEQKITKKTKAITVVHYLGNPVDMNKVLKIAKKYKLFVMEDCALALGAKVNNKHVGLLGDAGVFSFYPVKHMTTAEGGMIILKNTKMSKELRLKKAFGVNRNYSQRKLPGLYDVSHLGFNYRMSEIHAAIGVEQLKKMNFFLKKRKENFKYLEKRLLKISEISIIPALNSELKGSFYCLSFLLSKKLANKRFLIIKNMKKNKIGSSIYYPHPVPRLQYYKKKYKVKRKDYEIAKIFSDYSISLPIGPHLNYRDLNYMSSKIKKIIQNFV